MIKLALGSLECCLLCETQEVIGRLAADLIAFSTRWSLLSYLLWHDTTLKNGS